MYGGHVLRCRDGLCSHYYLNWPVPFLITDWKVSHWTPDWEWAVKFKWIHPEETYKRQPALSVTPSFYSQSTDATDAIGDDDGESGGGGEEVEGHTCAWRGGGLSDQSVAFYILVSTLQRTTTDLSYSLIINFPFLLFLVSFYFSATKRAKTKSY